MTSIALIPTEHQVFNEFDRFGLLLGLSRIEGEKNSEYKQRLLDVLVHPANATHQGLIYGITRELGLEIFDALTVVPMVDGNGAFLATSPAIVFNETKCLLYEDYDEGILAATIDRFAYTDDGYLLQDLVSAINETSLFTATLATGVDPELRSMVIFNQSSINTVPYEGISGLGLVVSLEHRDVVPSSIALSSSILKTRVSNLLQITHAGDYYIDCQAGILYTLSAPAPGDMIRYQYVEREFTASASPVIIHNLQSEDFKTEMFEPIIGDEEGTLGLPTILGADCINELISVYPVSWGK
jgi:hypothetical protein